MTWAFGCLVTISVPENLFFLVYIHTSHSSPFAVKSPVPLCFFMISCSHLLAEAVSAGFVPGWCVMGTVLGWASFSLSAQCGAVRPAFPLIDLLFPAAPEHAKGRAYESITSLARSWLWGAPELCGSLQFHLNLTDLGNAKKPPLITLKLSFSWFTSRVI